MVTSIVMLIISLTKLGTTCKLCVGIYLASTACFVGAVAVWRKSTKHAPAAARGPNPRVTKPKKADLPDEPAFTGGSNALPREPVEEPRAVKVSPRGLVPGVASEPAGNGFLARRVRHRPRVRRDPGAALPRARAGSRQVHRHLRRARETRGSVRRDGAHDHREALGQPGEGDRGARSAVSRLSRVRAAAHGIGVRR
jgi:hypothetical protein